MRQTPLRSAGVLNLLATLIVGPQVLAQPPKTQDAVDAVINVDSVLWGVQPGGQAPSLLWQNQAQLDLGVRLSPPAEPTQWRAQAAVRWRTSDPQQDPGPLIGSSGLFDPSDYGAGTGVRLMNLALAMDTERVSLLAGWIQPQQHFLQQPLSKLVLNHAVLSAKGVGGNIPFVSSFSTWGGLISWRPRNGGHIKAGAFMTYPDATASSNNGVWFGGNPNQPGTNRMGGLVEAARPIALGRQRQPGLVAVGGYMYNGAGVPATPTANQGTQVGGYLQWDQQLWSDPQGTGRRVDVFSVLSAAPAANNTYPLYGHLGLAMRGPLSSRPQDLLITTVAMGAYARAMPDAAATSSLISELGYQLALDPQGHIALYPFAQWVVRPNGTASQPTAVLAGISARLRF